MLSCRRCGKALFSPRLRLLTLLFSSRASLTAVHRPGSNEHSRFRGKASSLSSQCRKAPTLRANRRNCFLHSAPSPSRSSFYPSGHRLQKTEERVVDLRRSFHLHPVPGAFDEHFAAHVSHPLVHLTNPTASPEADNRFFLPAVEHQVLSALRGFELRRKFEVSVNVPVPIQRPAEATLLVLRDVVIEVLFGEPIGQEFGAR